MQLVRCCCIKGCFLTHAYTVCFMARHRQCRTAGGEEEEKAKRTQLPVANTQSATMLFCFDT